MRTTNLNDLLFYDRYFFNALNNEVNLYSIATGEVVRTFTFPPPKDRRTEVTAIAVSTLNRDHVSIKALSIDVIC
jgi:hypothetical protein